MRAPIVSGLSAKTECEAVLIAPSSASAPMPLGTTPPVQFAPTCQLPAAFTFHAGGGAPPTRRRKASRRERSPQLLVKATHFPSKLMFARGLFQYSPAKLE